MGGPRFNNPAGLGGLSQQIKHGSFNFQMPYIIQIDLPVEVIVVLMPEMVRNQEFGVSTAILALLSELRDTYGMLRVEPLWPVGIGAVDSQAIRRGRLGFSLPPSAKEFLSNAQMLMGGVAVPGGARMSREEEDQSRMRLKLTFSPRSDAASVVRRIESVGGVDYAEEVTDSETPALPAMTKQQMFPKVPTPKAGDPPFFPVAPWAEWARKEIGWIESWNLLPLQNIAVFDSGADSTHPSLANAIDFANDESKADPSGHGTFVAGIIAGRAKVATKELGLDPEAVSDTMNGLLPAARLWVRNVMNPVAVRSNDNKLSYRVDPGRYSDALNQIAKAKMSSKGDKRLRQIQVVNLSLGSTRLSKTEQRDIALLTSPKVGVTVVASVGNHTGNILYPAAFKNVIAVGALAYKGGMWSGTNTVSVSDREADIDLLAPGEFILSAMPRTPSAMGIPFSGWLSGTSMAAPYASAVAAVLRYQGKTSNELLQMISDLLSATDYPKLKCPKG